MPTSDLILRKRLKREALIELNEYMGKTLNLDQYLKRDEITCRITLRYLLDRMTHVRDSTGSFWKIISWKEDKDVLIFYCEPPIMIAFQVRKENPMKITLRVDVDDKHVELEDWSITLEDEHDSNR